MSKLPDMLKEILASARKSGAKCVVAGPFDCDGDSPLDELSKLMDQQSKKKARKYKVLKSHKMRPEWKEIMDKVDGSESKMKEAMEKMKGLLDAMKLECKKGSRQMSVFWGAIEEDLDKYDNPMRYNEDKNCIEEIEYEDGDEDEDDDD